MKYLVFIFTLLFVASPVFASNAYEPTDNECRDGDLAVHTPGDLSVVDSCLPQADVEAEAQFAKETQLNGVFIEYGQTVLTTYGFNDTCDVFWGCRLHQSLFIRFLD